MSVPGTTEEMRCSFCGKDRLDVEKLVAGPGVFICNECIGLCDQIIADELAAVDAGPQPPRQQPPDLRHWSGLSDGELLTEMAKANGAHDNVDRAVRRYVAALRERAVSWARIGEALGMTRQSAWERFSGEE